MTKAPLCVTALLGSLFMSAAAVGRQQVTGPSSSPVSEQRAFIDQYCVSCHNDRLKTGGLAINTFDVEQVGRNPEVWEKVLRKVRARYMPPISRPRPTEASYESFAHYLETSLDRAAVAEPNPGRTDTFHRLNRTEYQNAI